MQAALQWPSRVRYLAASFRIATALVVLALACCESAICDDDILNADKTRTPIGQGTGTSNFSMSAFTGAAGYSYPIEVPPGRLGMQPDISLLYSSAGADGLVGVGWSLAQSYVQRRTKDGLNYGADAYIFVENGNAQDLVYVGDAGTLGYEYRLEEEDGRYLRIFRRRFNPVGMYEWYWVVLTKEGIEWTFGSAYAPNIWPPGVIGVPPFSAFRWQLTRVEDSNGNYMTYQSAGGDEKKIGLIRYAGNSISGLQPTNEIKFLYGARPLPYRTFEARGYSGILHDNLLEQIVVRAGGALVARYTLGYSTSANTQRPLLASVTRYGSDGTSALPATTFSYSGADDTRGEFVHAAFTAPPGYSFAGSNNKYKFIAADFTRDGVTDLLHFYSNQDMYLWRGNGDGSFTKQVGPVSDVWPGYSLSAHDDTYHFAPVDLNGDGTTDLIHFVNSDYVHIWESIGNGSFHVRTRWPVSNGYGMSRRDDKYTYVAGNFDSGPNTDLMHITGSGSWNYWQANLGGPGDPILVESGSLPWPGYAMPADPGDLYGMKTGDFNADGKTDIWHFSGNDYGQIWQSTGNHEFSAIGLHPGYNMIGQGNRRYLMGDYNGDGLTDVINFRYDTDSYPQGTDEYAPRMWLSKGYVFEGENGIWQEAVDGPLHPTGWAASLVYPKPDPVTVGDFNGDGRADILQRYTSALGEEWARTYLSNGTGALFACDAFLAVDMPTSGSRHHFGDFNGDGRTDFMYFSNEGTAHVYCAAGETADLLVGIDEGDGTATTITYESNGVNLPFIRQVVTSVTAWPQDDEPVTTTYDYLFGDYDHEAGRFLGFGEVTTTGPDGNFTVTTFDQDEYLGRRLSEKLYTAGSNPKVVPPITETLYTWQSLSAGGSLPDLVCMASTRTIDHNPGGSGQVEHLTEYLAYDVASGYCTEVRQRSITDPTAESVTDVSTYQNFDIWNWRKTQQVVAGSLHGEVRRTTYGYQSGTGNLQSAVYDLPTAATNPSESWTYTAEGNLQQSVDASGNTTTVIYEQGTMTFVAYVFYPGTGHYDQQITDPRFGVVTTRWDRNRNKTVADVDPFGRVTQTTSYVGDGPQIAAREATTYSDVSNPTFLPRYKRNLAYVETTGGGSQTTAEVISKVTYFDRLGRTIQEVTLGADGQHIVNQAEFDPAGHWSSRFGSWLASPQGSGTPAELNPFYPYPRPAVVSYTTDEFDVQGRIVERRQAGHDGGPARVTQYDYDGLITEITDPDGRRSRQTLDYLGRLVGVIDDPAGIAASTAYTYDAAGEMLTMVDPLNVTTQYSYDKLGRMLSIAEPTAGTRTFTWNANGTMASQADAAGRLITYGYDGQARRTSKTAGGVATSFVYDSSLVPNAKGRLATVSNDKVSDVIDAYDTMGRPMRITRGFPNAGVSRSTQYEYDIAGRLRKMTYSSGYFVTYSYEPGTSILRTITGSDGLVYASFAQFTAEGRPCVITYGNQNITTLSYDPASNRLLSLQTTTSASVGGWNDEPENDAANRRYVYSPAGDLLQLWDYVMGGIRGQPNNEYYDEFTYDALHRLTRDRPSLTAISQWAYTYDKAGNRASKQLLTNPSGALIRQYTYAYDNVKKNRLVQVSSGTKSWGYQYDAAGNATVASDFSNPDATATRELSYDAEGRVTRIEYTPDDLPEPPVPQESSQARSKDAVEMAAGGALPVSATFTYEYNGTGERCVRTKQGGAQTYYIASHHEIVDGSTIEYIMLGSQRLAMRSGGAVYYFHHGHDGSVLSVTDQNGALADRTFYDAFGAAEKGMFTYVTRYGFTGQENDQEVDLLNFKTRFYDSDIGRYLQVDPVIGKPGDTQAANHYAYARNNPLMYTDPYGQFFLIPILWGVAGGAIVGAASSAVIYTTMALVGDAPWTFEGLWYSMKAGAIGGAISGGFGALGLGAIGNNMVYNMMGNVVNQVGVGLAQGAEVSLKTIINAATCGAIVGAIPNYSAVSSKWYVNLGTEAAYNTGKSAVAGGMAAEFSGGDFKDGAVLGAYGGLATTGWTIIAFGPAVRAGDVAGGGLEQRLAKMEADQSLLQRASIYKPVYRTGWAYRWLTNRGLAAGRNLFVPDASASTAVHETAHYYQQIDYGFGKFMLRGMYEMIFGDAFGLFRPYYEPGYQEYDAKQAEGKYAQ